MSKAEFPQVKERMETNVFCAHNLTRNCSISSEVAATDLSLQPLRALKMLMDGLATDGVSSLWLKSLFGPPLMMHLFPFDFLYLDEDLRVVEAVELFPNMPFPKFEKGVASALILPLRTLASTGTEKGDQLIICSFRELDQRLAQTASQQHLAPVAIATTVESAGAIQIPYLPPDSLPASDPVPAANPAFDQRVPIRTSTVSPTAGFTVSLATTWQVTRTTTPAATMPEPEQAVAATPSDVPVEDPIIDPETAPSTDKTADTETPPRAVSSAPAPIEPAESSSAPVVPSHPHTQTPESGLVPGALLQAAIAATEATETPESSQASEESETDQRIARSREAWEKTQVRPPTPTSATSVKTRKNAREPKKDPLGTRVIRWLNLEDPPPERRKIIRLRLEGLLARDMNGDHTTYYEMRDVCPTGFCLRARNVWRPGQLLSLVIERKGPAEQEHEFRVRVQARVVRCEEDGVGMEFVFPKGTEFQPWERAKTKRSDETEAAFIVRELRFSNALGLLRRLCPTAAEQVRHAFHERLSNKRVASAVDIVLLAEELLARDGQIDLARAHNDMVMRIVESGSWIEDAWIRKLWAGLLVSSCSADGLDTSNQPFIDLLAKLTPLHLRILSFVCGKAAETVAAGHPAKEFYLDCTTEELMEASDWHSFARIQQTVGHLSGYGLFAETARPSYVTLADKSKMRIATTALGLRMWARCNGQHA